MARVKTLVKYLEKYYLDRLFPRKRASKSPFLYFHMVKYLKEKFGTHFFFAETKVRDELYTHFQNLFNRFGYSDDRWVKAQTKRYFLASLFTEMLNYIVEDETKILFRVNPKLDEILFSQDFLYPNITEGELKHIHIFYIIIYRNYFTKNFISDKSLKLLAKKTLNIRLKDDFFETLDKFKLIQKRHFLDEKLYKARDFKELKLFVKHTFMLTTTDILFELIKDLREDFPPKYFSKFCYSMALVYDKWKRIINHRRDINLRKTFAKDILEYHKIIVPNPLVTALRYLRFNPNWRKPIH